MAQTFDVVIIGAGAAGMMCAATAGYRGRRVLLLDHANRAGKKILMSGGGRCNFTHLHSTPDNFLSQNPGFCISALKRYTPQHFLELVERHGIAWVEKAAGQLFCAESSKDIQQLLLTECEWSGVTLQLKTAVQSVTPLRQGFRLHTSAGLVECESLVVATGGLSIPTLGASGFGYQLAEQFALSVLPRRAGLVPFTLQPADKEKLEPLSGVSIEIAASSGKVRFEEPMLVTHRGLSGPAILQISSFWQPGESVLINLLPREKELLALLKKQRLEKPNQQPEQFFSEHWPKRFAQLFCHWKLQAKPWQQWSNAELEQLVLQVQQWPLKPSGTEGFRTAEVTLGGVDTTQLSSKTMAATDISGLYFIGEVVDVTGHLGGHNFQWAWASGWSAGQVV